MYADLPGPAHRDGPFRLYRFSPNAMYLLDTDTSEGDRRIPVALPLR